MRFWLLAALFVIAAPARAQQQNWELFAMTSNDEPFASDGGGLTASFLFGAKYKDWTATLWGGGYTPEQRGSAALRAGDKGVFNARITGTLGKDVLWNDTQAHIGGYFGADGLNRVGESVQCGIHKGIWSTGCPTWPAAGDHNHIIGGVFGWARGHEKLLSEGDLGRLKTSPFGYASVGPAYINGGGGAALDWVWSGRLPTPLPNNGLYDVDITNGQGVRAYAGADAVVYDHILQGSAKNFIPYAGVLGQVKWTHVRALADARCRGKSYNSAPRADCELMLTLGLSF